MIFCKSHTFYQKFSKIVKLFGKVPCDTEYLPCTFLCYSLECKFKILQFTVRNSICGKVMFLRVSVCPYGGGVHHPQADTPRQIPFRQTPSLCRHPLGRHPPLAHTPETATAADGSLLLECILVFVNVCCTDR